MKQADWAVFLLALLAAVEAARYAATGRVICLFAAIFVGFLALDMIVRG